MECLPSSSSWNPSSLLLLSHWVYSSYRIQPFLTNSSLDSCHISEARFLGSPTELWWFFVHPSSFNMGSQKDFIIEYSNCMQLLGYMLNSLAKHPISGRAHTNTHTHTYAPLELGWCSEPLWNKLWQSALTNTDLKTSNQSLNDVFSHPHYCLYSYTPFRYKLAITSIWSHISQSDAFPTTPCWWIPYAVQTHVWPQ